MLTDDMNEAAEVTIGDTLADETRERPQKSRTVTS
jgi:hypothetical protein